MHFYGNHHAAKYDDYLDNVSFLLAKQLTGFTKSSSSSNYSTLYADDEHNSSSSTITTSSFLLLQHDSTKRQIRAGAGPAASGDVKVGSRTRKTSVGVPDRIVYLHEPQLLNTNGTAENRMKSLPFDNKRFECPGYENRHQSAFHENDEDLFDRASRSRSYHNHDHCEMPLKTVPYHKPESWRGGVKKLRERGTMSEEESCQHQQCIKTNHVDSSYYRILHQRLQDLVASMDNGIYLSSSISLQSSINSTRTEASNELTVDSTASRRMKGLASSIYSTLHLDDFPELQDLQKNHGRISGLEKQKKAVMYVAELCFKSGNYLHDHQGCHLQRTDKSAEFTDAVCFKRRSNEELTAAAADIAVDEYALELGLRGIVQQYLQDVIDEGLNYKQMTKNKK